MQVRVFDRCGQIVYYNCMTIEQIKEKINPILRANNVEYAALFGSVARGEDRPDSDVDVLVRVKRPYGLVQFISLKHRLEDVLNRPVDVVEYDAIKPAFAQSILKDATPIYGK